MLTLARKEGESLKIGDNIFVTVVSIRGHTIRLGISAPREIPVLRVDHSEVPPPKHLTEKPAKE